MNLSVIIQFKLQSIQLNV